MLISLPARVQDPLAQVHLRWTSIWFGIWHGLMGYILVAVLFVLMSFLFWRVWRAKAYRAEGLLLVNLLTVFVLYVTSIVTVPTTVKSKRAAIWIVGLSLVAFVIYSLNWPFGGSFTVIPLAALYFMSIEVPKRNQEGGEQVR